jgi:hypothetical protein
MKNFPRPEIFRGALTYTPFIPPNRFCELHILRLRKVAISISIPEFIFGMMWLDLETIVGLAREKLETVHFAIMKTTDLRKIHFIIKRGEDSLRV